MKPALLVLLLVLAAYGCAPAGGHDESLVLAIDNHPQNLDPRVGTDIASQKVHQLIFNGLFRKDEDGNLVPDLALDHEIIDDRRIVIRLKPGVVFHDGRPLSAADVRYTFASLLRDDFRSFRKSAFQVIRDLEATGDLELVITLAQPQASFFDSLTMGIVPENSPDDFNLNPVGSGPYRYLGSRGNLYRFAPFYENQANVNNFSTLIIKVLPDPVSRSLELQRQSVDLVVNDIPLDNLALLAKKPFLQVLSRSGSIYHYLGLNLRDPHLQKLEVRKALALGTDREAIIRHLYHGYARRAETVLPPANRFFLSLEERLYDPRRSRELLKQAGYDENNPLRLTMKCSHSGLGRKLALAFQEQWRQINVDLKLAIRDFSSFYAEIRDGNFQVYYLAWVGVSDPDIFQYVFHSRNIPPHGANRGFYNNAEVDLLCEQAGVIYDVSRRLELYHRLQETVFRDFPYVSLWYSDNVAVVNRRVNGFRLYSAGEFGSLPQITLAGR